MSAARAAMQASFLLRTDLPDLAFERGSGRLVASAGLHRTDWWLPATEVDYWVRTREVGRGYATEAVSALAAWALEGVLCHTSRSPDGGLRNLCRYAKLPADD